MKTALVIPVYNEEKHIRDLLLKAKGYCDYIIVVDDGSRDESYSKAREVADDNTVLIKHEVNSGKGGGSENRLRPGGEA